VDVFLKKDFEKQILFVDATVIDNLLEIPDDDDDSDIEYLERDFLGYREEGHKKRISQVGTCARDFIDLCYPSCNLVVKNWWSKIRKDVVNFIDNNPEFDITFVSKLSWPWTLMPLENDTPLDRKYRASISPSFDFIKLKDQTNTIFVGEGNVDSNWTGGEFEGWDATKQIYENHTENTPNVSCRISNLATTRDFEENIIGFNSSNDLADFVHTNCHGHQTELELKNQKLSGEKIKQVLDSSSGAIRIWISESCWGAQMFLNHEIMKTKKIGSLICHTGIADEQADSTIFVRVLWSHLTRGSTIGEAFLAAKQAVADSDPSSGSFTLLGNPKTRLFS
jgi:hypothetical protein